jgi:hypothetical protein
MPVIRDEEAYFPRPPLSEHEIICDFDASLRGNSLVPKLLDKSARDYKVLLVVVSYLDRATGAATFRCEEFGLLRNRAPSGASPV